VLRAARLLEQGVGGGNPLRFDRTTLRVVVQDRLRAPNDQRTYEALLPALQQAARVLYGNSGQVETVESDPRQAFSARLSWTSSDAPPIETLLAARRAVRA